MSAGTERILDLAEGPAFLRVENEQLVIEREDMPARHMPIAEVAVILAANQALVFTQAVLAQLASGGGVLVVCDQRSMPVSMVLPCFGHALQAQRLRSQIGARRPLCKRLWQQLVQRKIAHQALVLQVLRGTDEGLAEMVARVRSGDTGNLEAQAARRYWQALFGREDFRRDAEGEPPNDLLNYGYAVLRAIVARAVCAAALHPALGVHHRHRDNSFCLADDLMEPLRPLVDHAAVGLDAEHVGPAPLDRVSKGRLIAPLLGHVRIGGELRTVFDAVGRMSASLAHVLDGAPPELLMPELVLAAGT